MSDKPFRNVKLDNTIQAKEVYDVFCIDRSSSMNYQRDATIEGINKYLKKLQADSESLQIPTFVSVIFFDDGVETMFEFINVKEVPLLTHETYKPDGMTALNDAVGQAIDSLRTKLKGREGDDNVDVNITVFTDGDENQSSKYPGKGNLELQGLTKELTDSYGWNFVFNGVGDRTQAVRQAADLGINASNAQGYSYGPAGVCVASAGLVSARSAKMDLFSKGTKSSANFFAPSPSNTLDADDIQNVVNVARDLASMVYHSTPAITTDNSSSDASSSYDSSDSGSSNSESSDSGGSSD